MLVKGYVVPVHTMKAYKGAEVYLHSFFISALGALFQVKNPCSQWVGGWLGPRTSLDSLWMKTSFLCSSKSLYWLYCPHFQYTLIKTFKIPACLGHRCTYFIIFMFWWLLLWWWWWWWWCGFHMVYFFLVSCLHHHSSLLSFLVLVLLRRVIDITKQNPSTVFWNVFPDFFLPDILR
jgi:hypothetical protein